MEAVAPPIAAPAEAADGPLGLTSLSPSRAGDFKTCPQLFKFRAIDRIPDPPTEHQARGTTAHLALQRLFDLPAEQRTPDRLFDLFREAWVDVRDAEFPGLFSDVDGERRWGIESLRVLANYFGVEDPAVIQPAGRELELDERIGHMEIRGILDRMDETTDGLVITDYKTGRAPPERYAIPAFFALKIYGLLVRHRTGRTPAWLRLLYLNGPTVYEIRVTDAQLDAMERQLAALWRAIDRAMLSGTFPARPSRLCDWCSYRGLCPAWKTADEEVAAFATR